jgi:DsbC/DsbD-like thiol-disulfide interchange protein
MDPLMTVFIYVDTSKEVGDPDHLKVFANANANADAAEAWFAENDPEGVAFEYNVLEVKEVAN